MNIAEAELLDRSMSRFGDTLLRNRMMREDQRRFDTGQQAQRDELTQHMGLQREEMTARTADREDARTNRKLSLEAQTAHQQRLETIQKEGNETKRNQQYMDFLGELNKTGQLTDEGIGKMEEAFNKQFGVAGLGVKLFRAAPPKEPRGEFGTQASHNLKTAEEYRKRAVAAKQMGNVEEATRFLDYATKLENSFVKAGAGEIADPPAEPPQSLEDAMRTGAAKPLQDEIDKHTAEISKGDPDFGFMNWKDRAARVRELEPKLFGITNRVTELDRQRPQIEGAPAMSPAAGGDRVTVVSPSGKRGTIPKAQLAEALKQGFKEWK